MQVSFSRDLYKVWLCMACEKEEEDFGYALPMCARNHIDGLLPCHLQHSDDRLKVCWDVTGRMSLFSLLGEGILDGQLMRLLFRSLLKVMEHMEGYLVPCEHLLPDPEYIFLDAGLQEAAFVCDFENPDSFHSSALMLGEYILAHMDHRDKECMALGYGFYRLVLQESFDKEGLKDLLEEETEERTETAFVQAARAKGRGPAEPEDTSDMKGAKSREEMLRREALEAFEKEDEEKEKKSPFWLWLVCGLGIFCSIVGMEILVFFRNGKHMDLRWILVGGLLMLFCGMVLGLLHYLKRAKAGRKKAKPDFLEAEEENSLDDRKKWEAYIDIPEEARGMAVRAGTGEETCQDRLPERSRTGELSEESYGETVVLSSLYAAEQEKEAQLVGKDGYILFLKGRQWILGKQQRGVDLSIPGLAVSRMHARIYKKEGNYYLEDLNSRNGTSVNGEPVQPGEVCLLADGDRIVFADQGYIMKLWCRE